ncbi:hypothetical protein CCR75_004106 [Bremia lactucae]|uniref:Uncharacterized protein n=1 Tax=Bremia lactucae TaxID=4779 RepID=A0A976IDZ9_BRELC|nr:hypothetical protein CCR75_004106 [Bremia lactucae]
MARSRGVTCRACGCLNFSSEHETCDKCRLQALASRPIVRRIATSNGNRLNLSCPVDSTSQKRRHDDLKSTMHEKTSMQKQGKRHESAVSAVNSPVVIDLVSDDEIEHAPSLQCEATKTKIDTQLQDETRALFQSRIFPVVPFVASDFPSIVQGTELKKKMLKRKLLNMENTLMTNKQEPEKAGTSKTVEAQVLVSKESIPTVNEELKKVLTKEKDDTSNATTIANVLVLPSALVPNETKREMKMIATNENVPIQSRVFDVMEFQASDFITVFDGLALARRSHVHGPLVSTTVAPTSVKLVASSLTVSKSAAPLMTESTTLPVIKTSKGVEAAPIVSTRCLEEVNTVFPTTSTAATCATESESVLKASVSVQPSFIKPLSKLGATAEAVLSKNTGITLSTRAIVTPPVKTLERETRVIEFASKGTKASPKLDTLTVQVDSVVPVPQKSTPAASLSTTVVVKDTTPAPVTPVMTLTSKAPNVLVPKKKRDNNTQHRAEAAQPLNKSSVIDIMPVANVNGIDAVEASGIARELLSVKPPELGYCCPAFLAFMRECGNEDGDDDEDELDEDSRSQLRLLDVVDLTSLSDSEDSDAFFTPRNEAFGQPDASAEDAVVCSIGLGATLPLDLERKRTQLEKAMCELCEEKGVLSRLIRCLTCMKYYHKKCAKENGDENTCWNCELGSIIDDSELEKEHAEHSSEYLTYLKALRHATEEEHEANRDEISDEEGQEEDVDSESSREEGEIRLVEEEAKFGGKVWMEYIGGVTADVDASYEQVTDRITKELQNEETRRLYSRGFVSRDEFETQMTQVEEYYIHEEARLQQLERLRTLEAKQAAEAKKTQLTQRMDEQELASNDSNSIPVIVPVISEEKSGTRFNAIHEHKAITSNTSKTIVPVTTISEHATVTSSSPVPAPLLSVCSLPTTTPVSISTTSIPRSAPQLTL